MSTDEFVGIGLDYYSKKLYEKAIEFYNKALEINLNHVPAHINKATSLVYLEKYEEAIKSLNKALELEKDHPIALENKANILFNHFKDYQQVKEIYQKLIKINSTSYDGLRAYAESLFNLGEYDEALKIYNDLLTNYPEKESDLLFQKARTLSQLRRYEEAKDVYTELYNKEQGNKKVLLNLGITWIKLKDYKKAIECFDSALAIDPNYLGALLNKGALYVEMEDYQKGMEFLSLAKKLQPENPQINFNLGTTYLNQENYDKALENYEVALKYSQEPNFDLLINMGVAYSKLGLLDKSLSSYEKILILDPQNTEALNNKASLYLDSKKYFHAMETLNKLLSIDKFNVKGLFNRGLCFYHLKRYDEALEDFQEALNLYEHETEKDKKEEHDLRVCVGITLGKTGKFEHAHFQYDKANEVMPNSFMVINNKGSLYLEQKKYDKALDFFNEAIKIYPSEKISQVNKCFTLYKMGNYKGAIKYGSLLLEEYEMEKLKK
ncbi:MAG: tetratricopeptide repeat protein [Candidatus Nitrosocosmicus sp.]|jgi:superkiller protein 3